MLRSPAGISDNHPVTHTSHAILANQPGIHYNRCHHHPGSPMTNQSMTPLPRSASGAAKNSHFACFVCFAVLLATTAHAVEPGPEILLWPNGAPGSQGKTGEVVVRIAERGERVL